MEISTFELLVKRIAPPPAPPTLARRVVQGYFLTVANLEDSDILYRIDFTPSIPNPPNPDRALRSRAEILVDVAGANLRALQGFNGATLFGFFRVPARQTASVQLLPLLPNALLTTANPDIEIRGFVTLQVSRLFNVSPTNRPARVLLNPETRGTFLPNGFPTTAGEDFDQINYPMALATGRALNEIAVEPLELRAISAEVVSQVSAELLRNDGLDLEVEFSPLGLNNVELASTLATLVGQVDPSDGTLANVSDLFSKLNIPIRMERVSSPTDAT